jgi:hypothetical protein
VLRKPLSLVWLLILVGAPLVRAAEPFRIQLDTVREGYDGRTCFVQARAGIVPREGQSPIVVMTMNPLIITGSDVYLTIHDMRTDDLGKTWTPPTPHETLARRPDEPINGKPAEIGICDMWPKWHAKTGKLLSIGHTLRYVDDKEPVKGARRETCYTVYDPEKRTWSSWKRLMLPGTDLTYPAGAGCSQRVDLPNGDILLPVYGREQANDPYTYAMVLKLRFDGETLTVIEEGSKLRLDTTRGLSEPSLTRFRGKYYLAVRHDDTGYCTTSDDGLHFGQLEPWKWDDGTSLGNYNTQTHWVNHSDALYLVYTRKGANNDHVFRHRAPLFIAEIDPQTLRVKRATERILIPERGARYGNFGVTEVSENETWVTETEWMQIWKQPSIVIPVDNKWGAKNRVYAARILWDKPNTTWNER